MIKDFQKTAIVAGDSRISYSELLLRVNHYSSQFSVEEGSHVLLFSENRVGWIYTFFAIWNNRCVVVPVDASSTVHDVAYILKDCKPTVLWVSRARESVLREAMEEAGHTAELLFIEDFEEATLPTDMQTAQLPEFDVKDANGESPVSLIIYTSGTTGSPKGVMLTYANLAANIHGVADEVPIFNEKRRTLILLPLHHVLPLMGSVIAPITRGGGVAIAPSMSGPDIMKTLCDGQVAIMIGVPRLWQTLYMGIKKKIDANFLTRALFNLCAKIGNRKFSSIVFASVRKKMGGHIDYCVSGGAALDKEIGEGLRTLGLEVLEGYGMTETAPIISFTRPGDVIPGCAGLPLPSVECKIVNGELLAKGPNVMKGYYNRPEETAAVLDADGFIHTGDLASFDECGRVIITGRSKEIIVLSNGKNVQPSEIEYKIEKFDDMVKETAVAQDGDKLCAIIVPQPAWAQGKSNGEMREELKRLVIEPYNLTVAPYKKIMSVYVYENDLPRTKLDKLQRFKLKDIIAQMQSPSGVQKKQTVEEPTTEEYQILKTYIEGEKKVSVQPLDHIESDLAFDSLDKVSLQGFVEQTFGVTIESDAMALFPNLKAMAEHVAEQKTHIDVENVDWHQLLVSSTSELELPTASCTHKALVAMFRGFFRMYNKLSIKGKENIPVEGPFILAPNHQSFFDGGLVLAGVPSKHLNNCYFYATEEHIQSGFRQFMARRHNVVVMQRKGLKDSILRLGEVLKRQGNIIIFPEGARTHDGDVAEFKRTFAILSKELNVPIVPVCIRGAFEAFPRTRKFPKASRIEIEYLAPVLPSEAENYDDLSEVVRNRIIKAL